MKHFFKIQLTIALAVTSLSGVIWCYLLILERWGIKGMLIAVGIFLWISVTCWLYKYTIK